jgi:hypothetical protein
MFKSMLIICALGVLSLTGFSQTTQDRQVGDFTGLKVSSNIKVMLSQGDTPSVKVEGDEKDLPNVKTEVKDGNLEISGGGKGEIRVFVTAKTLNLIEVSGAASVKSQTQISADKLKLETSGAGSLKLDVKANEITGNVSGASVLSLSGTAQVLSVDVSGAASLKAYNLLSNKVIVSTAGASTAKVNALQSVDLHSSGASSITYKGDPKDRIVEASGASSIRTNGNDDDITSKEGDTMKVHMRHNDLMICDDDGNDDGDDHDHKSGFNYWSGIDLGMNAYLNADNKLNVSASPFLELNYVKSIDLGLNLYEKNFHLYKNYVNLITGIGFDFNHYSFRNPVTLNPDSDYITASTDSNISYSRNRLNVSYVQVPLMVMFNTNSDHPKRGFHIGAGVIGGYDIHSVTKQAFSIDGYNYSVKKRDDYNLNPFRLSATVRAGFSGFNLFATYALTSLFEDGKGPQLYPFTVGISLTGN